MYFKLKDIKQFQFISFKRTVFVSWDDAKNQYVKSDTWQQGYSKKYTCEIRTEKDTGLIDFSNAQFNEILGASWDGKVADPKDKYFTVRTNGKQGKEIRYFINPYQEKKEELPVINIEDLGKETNEEPPADINW